MRRGEIKWYNRKYEVARGGVGGNVVGERGGVGQLERLSSRSTHASARRRRRTRRGVLRRGGWGTLFTEQRRPSGYDGHIPIHLAAAKKTSTDCTKLANHLLKFRDTNSGYGGVWRRQKLRVANWARLVWQFKDRLLLAQFAGVCHSAGAVIFAPRTPLAHNYLFSRHFGTSLQPPPPLFDLN